MRAPAVHRQARPGIHRVMRRTSGRDHAEYLSGVLSRRLEMEAERVRDRIEHGDPFSPAQAAVASAVLLSLLLADPLTIGPRWLLPVIELALFVVLVTVVPRRATQPSRGRR